MTKGKGVDVIYDPVGLINGLNFLALLLYVLTSGLDSLKCIAWKGRALVIGFAAGTIEKVCCIPIYITQLPLRFVLGTYEPRVIEEHLLGRCALGCLHTSEYSHFPLRTLLILDIPTEKEASHVPVVWKDLLSWVFTTNYQCPNT